MLMGVIIAAVVQLRAADVDTTKLPPPAQRTVQFTKDIQPLLENACIKCHGPEKQKGKYRMDSREAAIKGGSSDEAAILPGNSAKSPLIHYVAGLVEDMEMPPLTKGNEPLTPEQVGTLRAWIDQGAKWE